VLFSSQNNEPDFNCLSVYLLKSSIYLQMRSGYGRCIFEPLLPLIIGRDISGEVAATGTSVSSFSIGQEVYGALHPTAIRGTCADYAVLSQDELTPKPSTLTHVVGILQKSNNFRIIFGLST
jgi:hypothetical protein